MVELAKHHDLFKLAQQEGFTDQTPGIIKAEIHDDARDVLVVMTTKHHLHNLLRCVDNTLFGGELMLDATHKMVHQGYPVFVVGCVDVTQRFHLVATALSSQETEDKLSMTLQYGKCVGCHID
jgi:hypothetical protein